MKTLILISAAFALSSCANLRPCNFGEDANVAQCRPGNASQARGNWMGKGSACPSEENEAISMCRAQYDCKTSLDSHKNIDSGAFQTCIDQNMAAQKERLNARTQSASAATPPASSTENRVPNNQ